MGAIAGAAGIVAIFWVLAAALLAGAVLAARTPFDELVDRGGRRRRVGDNDRPGPGGEGEDLDAAAKAAEASAPAAEV